MNYVVDPAGIARQLLKANGVVGKEAATFIDEDLPADAGPLVSGAADAAIIVVAADTDKVQQLLRVPNIRLMDFAPEAEAYTNRFPALKAINWWEQIADRPRQIRFRNRGTSPNRRRVRTQNTAVTPQR